MRTRHLLFVSLALTGFFFSLLNGQSVIPVAAGTDGITAAYTSATAGDIIELTTSGGLYIETKILTVTAKQITIRAKSGLVNKPIWACSAVSAYGGLMEISASVTVDGIIMDGTAGAPATATVNGIITKGTAGNYNITVKNSTFKNFATAIYGSSSAQVDSVIVSNCIFQNLSKYGIIIYTSDVAIPAPGSAKNVTISNSTFSNITTMAVQVEANDDVLGTTLGSDPVVTIDHVTFYNTPRVYTHYCNYTTIRNCIFSTGAYSYYIYGLQSSCVNSLYWNAPTSLHTATFANLISADPLFANAAGGDFTLLAGSPAYHAGTDGKSLGDLRWDIPPVVGPKVIPVAAGTDGITTAYTSATAGDIIELTTSGGLYIETTILVVTGKAVTIRAASGLANKPIWACTFVSAYGALMEVYASVTVDGIIMDGTGSTPATVNGIITKGTTGNYSITVKNSTFKNFSGKAIYGSSAPVQVDSVIISNCIIENISTDAINFPGQSGTTPAPGTFKYLSVTNSTFWNPVYRSIACIYTMAHDAIYSPNTGWTPDPRVEIDHVTIYNFRRLYCNSHTNVQIKNSIFVIPTVTSSTGFIQYGDLTSISNCMYFNVSNSFTGGVVQTNLMNADPLFKNAAIGDFTISNTSPAYNTGTDGKSLGDPRWWPKLSNGIYVEAGKNKISAALATANPGDIIELTTSGGLYQEATTLVINKSITIQASPSLSNKPIWTADSGGYLIRTKANLILIGITLDGSRGVKKSVGGIATDSIGYSIKLTNCDFVNLINDAGTDGHAITDGIYSGQIDSLIISGCIFKNIQKEGIYIAGHNAASIGNVKYFRVTNSTFSKISSDAIYVRDHDGVDATPGPTYIVDHCTFYDCFASYGVLAHHIDGAVIKNCVAYASVNVGTAYYIYGNSSILKNSLYYNLGINLHTSQSAFLINADPLFVDATNGNFMVYKNSPAVNAGDDGTTIGDPRWGVSTLDFGKLVVVKKPYSMSPTTNSVRVVWETPLNASDSSIVDYGITSALGARVSGPAGWRIVGEGYMHEVTLTGLSPFTTYYYRVGNGKSFSDTCTTKTAPAAGTNFRLMIGGDSRDNPPMWNQICASALKDNIDMSIHVGDLVTYSYDRTYGEEFFTPANVLNSKRPFIATIGNHEIEPGPGTTYYDYMSLPEHPANGERGESYYSMVYGDVKLIVVNDNGNFGLSTNEEFAAGSPQYIWLQNELASTTSKWVFIIEHTPILSTSLHGQWTAEAKTHLMPVYENYAAKGKHIVVFCGDDHNFEHLYKAGVNHFRPAGGGAELYDTGLNAADKPWSVFFKMVHNYSTIDVRSGGDTVIVQAHLPTGEIFYDVTLTTSGNQRPNIYINEPDGFDDETSDVFRIQWADSDPDDDAKISLYYTSTINTTGTLIVAKISENDSTNYYDWDVSHITPGSYYVYATIADTVNPPYTRFSSGKVTVIKDITPPPPVRNLTASVAKNKILLSWKNPNQTIQLEKRLATFETGLDSCTGLKDGGSSGSLVLVPGYTGRALRINYQIAAAWEQYAAILALQGFPNMKSTPFLDFWYRGDGSSRALRLIVEQDNDRNGQKDDWWYTESINLSSTEWKHAVIDLRTLAALSWHTNADKTFDLENIASIDFIVPSANAGSGYVEIDEIKITGQVSACPDFEGTVLVRKTVSYPTSPTDGKEVYRGKAEAYADSGLTVGQKYYYAAFAFDEVPNYSLLDSTSVTVSMVVSVVTNSDELPRVYRLAQNYPNPFNPSTRINFDLPETQHVTLTIYNSLGQAVLRPLDHEFSAGFHTLVFDASKLSSGVYYYRLDAGTFTSIMKMILVK